MKYYKSVLKKVEKINYKKGITRLTEESSSYKTTRRFYTLAFIWFMIFQCLYIASNTTVYFVYSEENVGAINMPLYITSIVAFFAMIAARVVLRFKLQVVTFVITVAAGLAQIDKVETVELFQLETIERSVLVTKYFWFHHAPIYLMMFFSLILLVMGIKRRVEQKKDYTSALNGMFESYSLEHPEASNADWTNYLEELDNELAEAEEQSKLEEIERKKQGRAQRKADKAEEKAKKRR